MQMKIINKKILKELLFNRILLLFYLIPFFLGFVLYYFENKFSFCLLINLTHLPCPICGLGRSFINFTHLKFIEAIQYNLMIVIIMPILILLIIIQLFKKRLKEKIYLFLFNRINLLNFILLFLILIFFIFGIIRILDVFFHFIGFKDIVPEITFIKILFKLLTNKFY